MRRILISNNVTFHYDVIESAVAKYDVLLGITKHEDDKLDVHILPDSGHVVPNLIYEHLVEMLKTKYSVKVINEVDYSQYDYEIHCTASATDAPVTDGGIRPNNMRTDGTTAYISHDVNDELLAFPNVFFLSGFGRSDIPKRRIFIVDKLPEVTKQTYDKPNFVVQGSFVRSKFDKTRDYSVLEDILSYQYDHDFEIFLVGNWHLPNFDIDAFINRNTIHHSNIGKLRVILNTKFMYFNTLCASADAIIPCVSKSNQPWMFENKITSSIIYCRGYKVPVFADDDFINAYDLAENEYFRYDRNDMYSAFSAMLESVKSSGNLLGQ